MKKILPLFFALVLFLATASSAFALTLESIGSASTSGLTFTTWTYDGNNPILTGTADPAATVSVKVDDLTDTVTADASGEWTWIPTTLIAGTYQMTISSGLDSMDFSLTIAASGTATPTATPTATLGKGGVSTESTTLPQSGSGEQTMLMMIGGLLFLGFGLIAKSQVYRS